MSSTRPAIKPPRLIFSLLLLVAALVAALLFASAYEQAPAFASAPTLCGESGTPIIEPSSVHDLHKAKAAGPTYFLGGLWSPKHDVAPKLDVALLSIATNERPIVCQSAIAVGGALLIIDRSPIQPTAITSDAKPNLLLSIDYAGGVSSIEYLGATALQQFITAQKNNYNRILIIEPLPGPDRDPDEDWTYLNFDGDESIDFFTPQRKATPEQVALALQKALGGTTPASATLPTLIEQLGSDDAPQAAAARRQLIQLSPYQAIPALNKWVDSAQDNARDRRVFEALAIRRALGVHADDLIAQAAASDNTQLRRLAARSIGDLADVTTDPFGKLTPLAEDDELAVRYEALVAARAMPGRRAAGVAQLVEPYEMTDAMRTVYQGTMRELLAYGKPIQADSKANRLRRMPIAELLNQDRDALVGRILLEKADLPDDKIDEVLGQLAAANGRAPLTELLDLLESINPSTLAKREVLLTKLVAWETNDLNAQMPRLKDIALGNGTQTLRTAAAAAMIRANGTEAVEAIGLRPVLFESLSWIDAPTLIKQLAPMILETAYGQNQADLPTRIAAMNTIDRIPADAITTDDTNKLLAIARGQDEIDLRFAAIRAINALPDALQPEGSDSLALTTLKVTAIAGMKYDKEKLTITAGRPVELTLINPDTMEHNLVITLPGRAQAIGIAMSADPTAAAAMGYVPKDDSAVLAYTQMAKPGTSDTVRFFAPTKPGNYDYVCTFPGHYTSMHGVLEVVKP